ncbi:ATP-binding cassette domain-containing protein [Salipiger aestuarii]|uniref:ATP-binding cassette domain-containing protein n=1 Tax=Salipiger aestuarii TaxID=568098 RepID=UPI0021E0431A|nr:ATP-binding cassette domain-containing protein [Salipiger aestuarii]
MPLLTVERLIVEGLAKTFHLRRSDIGLVTQFPPARPRVAAEDIAAAPQRFAPQRFAPLRVAGASADRAIGETRHRLAACGLREALWRAVPGTFSGAEKQRVDLARALIRPPRLLLPDAPTATLDAQARAAPAQRPAALKTRGVATIGVSHRPGDVARLINRTIDLTPSEVAHVAE